ncbi:MAG: hypothetical protein AAF481_01930 [Acidobacteriota bacterium]
MNDFAPLIAILSVVLGPIWLVRTLLHSRRSREIARAKLDLQTRLLDKFDSSQEMLAFLQSEAGTRFVESATQEKGNPFGRILGSIQAGLILLVGGIAFFVQRHLIAGSYEGFTFLGTLGIALGVGFLLSAGVAYFLSRSWGLLEPAPSVD